MPSSASLSFGTGSFYIYDDKNRHEVKEIASILKKHNVQYIDSARTYPHAEKILGEDGLVNEFIISTKADYPNRGAAADVLKSAEQSFADLGTDKVDTFFLHFPDSSTPIEDTMEGIQKLYLEGRFEKFGVSNFNLTEFNQLYNYAKSKNYILPTIFQANYNLLGRKAEAELFPRLRSLGVAIQAYSPIAGGFLAKSPEAIKSFAAGQGGRWDPSTPVGGLYNALYNKPSFLKFVEEYSELCKKLGESQVGVAYRWVVYNSFMDGEKGDQVILGAMSPAQLESTLEEIEKGALDAETVKKLDEMWEGVKEDAPFDNGTVIFNRKDE